MMCEKTPASIGNPKHEYDQACESMKEYAKMRFSQLTLFIAITAALLTILFSYAIDFTYWPKIIIKLGGLMITFVFFVMEYRSTLHWKHYKKRADWLEKNKLGYELHSTRPGASIISATVAVFFLYLFLIALWLLFIIWHPLF